MRKMMKAIAVVLAVSALMAGSAFAADKLVVKDSGGSNTVFAVTDTGAVGIGTAAPSVKFHMLDAPGAPTLNFQEVYDTGTGTPFLRYKLNKGGASAWYLKDNNGVEVGRIVYSTPSSFPGILFQTGPLANLNRFDLVNFGTYYKLYYNGFAGGLSIANTTNNVGIGIDVATSKLQVVGLPVHETNAAASGAGLTAGAFYRTSAGAVMVVY